MRRNSIWLACLLMAGLSAIALAPQTAYAQSEGAPPTIPSSLGHDPADEGSHFVEFSAIAAAKAAQAEKAAAVPRYIARAQLDGARADPMTPLPLGHDRMEEGGLFVNFGFAMYRQSNPLQHQNVAVRGLVDTNGTITGTPTTPGTPGTFIGSGTPALDVEQIGGKESFAPGFKIGIGWRFRDGSAIEIDYMHIASVHYNQTATLIPAFFQVGQNLADSFLFSPVFNFPTDYAGPTFKTRISQPLAAYGIWNGASLMAIDFVQHYDQVDIAFREPIVETDCYRCYGIIGPRFDWIWERFRWRTVDVDITGQSGPLDVAIYTNIVSNRMYGGDIGIGQDWWLGHGFSVSLDLRAALLLDIVKERAKFELGVKDRPPQNKRSFTDYTAVPQVQGTFNISYNPFEAVQFRVGWDAMGFFNTISSYHPVTFDWGAVNPQYRHEPFRLLDGVQASVGFVF